MVIQLFEPQKEGYKPLLKTKQMFPWEYVVMSKEGYDEPYEGESTYQGKKIPYKQYTVRVHDAAGIDENGKTDINVTGGPYVYFASEKLDEQIREIPVDVQFKVTQIVVDTKHGNRNMYKAERLDEGNAENTTKSTPQDTVSMQTTLKTLKDNGVPEQAAVATVVAQYDVTEEFAKQSYQNA